VCSLNWQALDLLGIESGDLVVVEGGTTSDGRVQRLTLRAFRAPEDMTRLRSEVAGGEMTARFPASRDALGVYPDLPWAFLDARTRALLGVGKLHPVRIRAERKQQLWKEVRELSLVIALGFFGLLAAPIAWQVRVGVALSLAVFIAWVLIIRLRSRLSRTRSVPL
jgi:hypothetical protein